MNQLIATFGSLIAVHPDNLEYINGSGPQLRDNDLARQAEPASKINRRDRLGGLLHEYQQLA